MLTRVTLRWIVRFGGKSFRKVTLCIQKIIVSINKDFLKTLGILRRSNENKRFRVNSILEISSHRNNSFFTKIFMHIDVYI